MLETRHKRRLRRILILAKNGFLGLANRQCTEMEGGHEDGRST